MNWKGGLGRHEEELKYWREVIQIDPQYLGAWRRIGDCLFTLGRYQEAVLEHTQASAAPADSFKSQLHSEPVWQGWI